MTNISLLKNEIATTILNSLLKNPNLLELREEVINEENHLLELEYENYKIAFEKALDDVEANSLNNDNKNNLVQIESIFQKYQIEIYNKDNIYEPAPVPQKIDHHFISNLLVSEENDFKQYASQYILDNDWCKATITYLNNKNTILDECRINSFIDHLVINGVTARKIKEILEDKDSNELDEIQEAVEVFAKRSSKEIEKIIKEIETENLRLEAEKILEDKAYNKGDELYKFGTLSDFLETEKDKSINEKSNELKKLFIDGWSAKFRKKAKENKQIKLSGSPLQIMLIDFIKLMDTHYPELKETFSKNWMDRFNEPVPTILNV